MTITCRRYLPFLSLVMMWKLLLRSTLASSTDAAFVVRTPPLFCSTPARASLSSLRHTDFLLPERTTAPQFRLSSTTTPHNSNHDNWKVPEYIDIPQEHLEFSFVRSSGAGGQNVNKVNSQVQLRLHVHEAYWIPHEVRQRLAQQQANRVSKEGVLTLAAQEHRTQIANRKAVLQKLHDMLLQAWPRPKERHMRKGISIKTKEQRKEFKRRRSDVKEGRRKVDF